MRTILEIIGTAVVVGLAGGAVGYLVRKNVAEGKIATEKTEAITAAGTNADEKINAASRTDF